MTKLSTRQILQLHAMHVDGASNQEIARALQINRNSVSSHLAGEIAYPAPIYLKIQISSPLVTSQWLTLRQAAAWIPGHPSPSKMQRIVAGRSWRGAKIPQLRTKIVSRRRVTTLRSIKAFVRQVYPPGVWITEDTLMNFLTYATIRNVHFTRLGWFSLTARPFGNPLYACRLPDIFRVAVDNCEPIDFPAELVHRATRIVHHVGTAVI